MVENKLHHLKFNIISSSGRVNLGDTVNVRSQVKFYLVGRGFVIGDCTGTSYGMRNQQVDPDSADQS
ncbi:hypothetical protein ACFQ49_04250 [Kroppenstedtia eburnea]|uniref:Spore germination protein gerPA/gerPF n=1 Tax=Kroppenstedtia eburnea TaxID=714067 RepID=A0A1N7J355_9BACL|nr:hypothetical protein [Kroppenstedtia eburnea]QKI82461.1 hypothetical protein GXN75_10875 [Kroppenstedtia eburnea]SIS43734.1 Spore germination protein gerPA/gerPF [Kroppenstedtia eburnea]